MSSADSSTRSPGLVFVTLMVLLVPLAVIILGAQRWLPPVASEHAPAIDRMLHFLLLATAGLLLIGHGLLGYCIWQFGRQQRVSHRLAHPRTEWKWGLAPLIIMSLVAEGGLLAFGVPVWSKYYAGDAPRNAVSVEVTAEQFAWTFRYPGADGAFGRTTARLIDEDNRLGLDPKDAAGRDDIVWGGELRLPANRPARLRLRSKDVIHSFFLPQHRLKQDTLPGMVIDAWFVPTQTGEFEILCTELCGLGHYTMRGVLKVLPPEEFEQWLKSNSRSTP